MRPVHLLPDRPLSPPEPTIDDYIRERHARSVRDHRKAELISEAMEGRGAFWSQAHNDHAEHVMGVLQRLIALPGISDAQRWQSLTTAVRGLADEYATWTVEEA